MTTATLQTPLEVILFFTSLTSHGVKAQSFATISEILKGDRDVRESDGYDEARLSPESLQQLYLTLLKDEVRNQAQRRKSPSPAAGQENGGSPNSKKRKISSPVLQSLSDAQEHEHLIPILVDKLYARYREQALQDIAKEEEAYKATQEEIVRIGRDSAKERVNGDDSATHKRTPSISSLLRDDEPNPDPTSAPSSRPASSQALPDGQAVLAAQQQTPLAGPVAAGQSPQTTPAVDPHRKIDHARSSSRPPSSGPSQPLYNPNDPYARPPPSSRTDVPRPALPPLSAQQTPVQSNNYAGRPPAPISVPGSVSPQQQNQSPGLQTGRSSQSPRIHLPPPPGMASGYASPTVPMHSSYPRPGQHMPSPVQMQQQTYPTGTQVGPRPSQYSQPNYPPSGQRAGHAQYPQHPPQQAQPYQNTPQQQISPFPPFQNGGQQGSAHGQPVPYQHYGALSGQAPLPGTPQSALPPHVRHPHITPVPSTARRVLPKIDTSTPSTKWKSTGPRTREKSPVAPPMSPMDMGSPEWGLSPEPEEGVKAEAKKGGKPAAEDTPSRPAGRGRGGRGGRGARGGNAASARTRSQSIASQTDDTTATRNKAGSRRGKPEPGTPMDETSSIANSTVGTPLPPGATQRRDTLRSIETPPVAARPAQKRKRANTLDVGSPSSPGSSTPIAALPTRPGFILGVRNMPRIASTILNDVTTHKLASMFQKPISEREAPGYREIVFQPTDLKTIRGQLQAGQRAILAADAAAQEGAGNVGTPSATAGSSKATSAIWLERSAEVMPPKAIINSSQLETEICRIFANAVMFNPDPKRSVGPAFRTRAKRADARRQGKDFDEEEEEADDDGGMVEDAREMFRDVERQLAGWRAAERTNVESAMGLDGANDEDQPMEDTPAEGEKEDAVEDDARSTRRRKA